MGWLSDTFSGVGDVVGDAFGGVKDAGNWLSDNVWEPIGDAAGNVGDWAQNMGEFTGSNLQDDWNKLRKNPLSLATAFDPVSAKLTNKTFGTDFKPYRSVYGGPTQENFQNAEERGIDTSNAQGADQIGRFVGDRAADYFTGGLGSTVLHTADAYGNDGDWQDALKSGVKNYAKNKATGGLADQFGLSPTAVNGWQDAAINIGKGAAMGGLSSGIQGNSVFDGAKSGATSGAISSGTSGMRNWYNGLGQDELPDIGTLGGTMQDEYGESTATMGGMTPTQVQANQQAQGTGQVPNSMPLYLGNDYGGREQAQAVSASPVDSFMSTIMSGGGLGGRGSYGLGNLASDAIGLYSANEQRKKMREQANGLRDLYSPNSPYAQQMRQQLERKDAAAGRRSQYGPREAELAARLADSQARMAPTLTSLYNQEYSARNKTANVALNGLQNLYNNYRSQPGYSSQWALGPNAGPQLPGDY